MLSHEQHEVRVGFAENRSRDQNFESLCFDFIKILLGKRTGEGTRPYVYRGGCGRSKEGMTLYDLVGHVPRYRMVGFGRILTKFEGKGVETV